MANTEDPSIFNPRSWGAIILAILAVALVAFGLSWQYKRIARESEEKMSSLEDIVEGSLVQDALDKFMMARINKNESQATIYFTENAMQQLENGEFILVDNFASYQIIEKSKLPDGDFPSFKFVVNLYGENKADSHVEIIVLKEILDSYFVHSISIGG
jgi:cell division protein YceG involved in septum cleavage